MILTWFFYRYSTDSPTVSGEDPPSVLEDNEVTISCHVKANPPALMVWYKDNSTLVLVPAHHQIFQTSELFQLKIERVKESDSGVYTCEAKSALGTASRNFRLTVEGNPVVTKLTGHMTDSKCPAGNLLRSVVWSHCLALRLPFHPGLFAYMCWAQVEIILCRLSWKAQNISWSIHKSWGAWPEFQILKTKLVALSFWDS